MFPNGRQIRAARTLLGMSREELAARAGVSTRTIDNLESEARNPNQATLIGVTTALVSAGVEFDPGDPETGRGIGVHLRAR